MTETAEIFCHVWPFWGVEMLKATQFLHQKLTSYHERQEKEFRKQIQGHQNYFSMKNAGFIDVIYSN